MQRQHLAINHRVYWSIEMKINPTNFADFS